LYINEYKNAQDKGDLFSQLKKSIEILRKNTLDPIIHIYHSPFDLEVQEYGRENGFVLKPVTYHRPFSGLIKILVEKIFILRDFPENEEVVLLDVDTAFKRPIDDSVWARHPILWSAEYYITQFRNLDKILPYLPWYEVDIDFNTTYVMYNTGVVYIPKEHRREICAKALWITDRLNDGKNPDFRHGNKLDEQIGLSIAIHNKYLNSGGVILCNDIIDHFWEEKTKGIKWWEMN
jgi:hypothetical protein